MKQHALEQCLAELDSLIDPEQRRRSRERVRRAISWEPVDYLPMQIRYPVPEDRRYDMVDWSRDIRGIVWEKELMLLYRLKSMRMGALIGDDSPMSVSTLPDCVLIPTLFQAYLAVKKQSFWMKPAGDRKTVEKMIEDGVPDLLDGWGWKIVSEAEFFLDVLGRYPHLRDCVKVCFTDVQGPFDNACEVVGDDFFYWLYDAPDLASALIDLMTETQIAWYDFLRTRFADEFRSGRATCSAWGAPANAHLVVDSCECISPEMYRQFSHPYNERIFRKYDGGTIHFCGNNAQIQEALLDTTGLVLADIKQYRLGTPECRRRFDAMRERKVGILYSHDSDSGPVLLKDNALGLDTGIFQCYGVKTMEEAKELLKTVRASAG